MHIKRAHQRNTATNEFDVDREEVEGQVRFVATDDHDHDDIYIMMKCLSVCL